MKIFIDTANVDEIRKANDMGIICGVTTNPSLIAKEGRDFKEVIKEIKVSNVAKSGKVHLSWKKDKDADKYRVYWSTSKNGSFKLIATVKENSFVQAKADLEQGSGSRSL